MEEDLKKKTVYCPLLKKRNTALAEEGGFVVRAWIITRMLRISSDSTHIRSRCSTIPELALR